MNCHELKYAEKSAIVSTSERSGIAAIRLLAVMAWVVAVVVLLNGSDAIVHEVVSVERDSVAPLIPSQQGTEDPEPTAEGPDSIAVVLVRLEVLEDAVSNDDPE